jgi:hypothetical protein
MYFVWERQNYLADMLQAELMQNYNVIILHAQRQHVELKKMAHQFALACYQFQFLTEKY